MKNLQRIRNYIRRQIARYKCNLNRTQTRVTDAPPPHPPTPDPSCRHYHRPPSPIDVPMSHKSNKTLMTMESAAPSWKAPPFHGLRNSPRIIPEYYMTTHLKNGILNINYYDMIIDDIRNLRPLSVYQMKYIRKKLTPDEYYEIIYEYNQAMHAYME